MEKNNQTAMSLLTLLPNGKVENDVRITDKAVTGICTVYVNRTDDDKEFLLREIGVAALDGSNLTEAVRIAVREAYDAAISHIAGRVPAAAPPPQFPVIETQQPGAKSISGPKQEAPATRSNDEDAAAPKNEANTQRTDEPADLPDTEAETEPSAVDLRTILNTPGQPGADCAVGTPPANGKAEHPADNGGIERIEFKQTLLPASDLCQTEAEHNGGGDDDGGDPEYQKALDTVITIFGKLHDCNNWKAGKILDERPDVIVDFCHRNSESYDGPKYTGPRVEQKESLFKLYSDAVRRAQKVA